MTDTVPITLRASRALAVRAPLARPVLVATTEPRGLTNQPSLAHVRPNQRAKWLWPAPPDGYNSLGPAGGH